MKTISLIAGALASGRAAAIYALPALTPARAQAGALRGAAGAAAPLPQPMPPPRCGRCSSPSRRWSSASRPRWSMSMPSRWCRRRSIPSSTIPCSASCSATPEMRQRVQQSLGSGVIVRADGLILTNNHVVEGGNEITVALSDKREFKAKVLLADPRTDLAVLKIDTKGERLPVVPFADSDAVQVGDLVLAIGDPFGVGQTVTMGIVSALARTQISRQRLSVLHPDRCRHQSGQFRRRAGHHRRQAGGHQHRDLFAQRRQYRHRLRHSRQSGAPRGGRRGRRPRPARASVQLAWVGASGQPVTSDIAASLGLPRPGGVLIKDVYPGGPLANAGVKTGEVVQSVDGVGGGRHAVAELSHRHPPAGRQRAACMSRPARRRAT